MSMYRIAQAGSFVAIAAFAAAAFASSAKAQQPQAPVIPAAASAERPFTRSPATLLPDAVVIADIVTFGDLILGLQPNHAGLPAFRAPALGESGTIQASRIMEAAKAAGLPSIEAAQVGQVVVTRAARRITSTDIEQSLKEALETRHGVDGRAFALIFDGGAPSLAVEPQLAAGPAIQDLVYDQRTRRVSAVVVVPGSASTRLKPLRVAGQLVETVEVVLPTRALGKGDTIASADVTLERRPREGVSGETVSDLQSAVGKLVRRPMLPGQMIRASDLQRNEVVARGDLVTMVYETPGLTVQMRGRATEAGAVGDVITVVNPQSKRNVQATVTGAGRVSVNPLSGGRVAIAD